LVQHSKIFVGLGAGTETAIVLSRRCHLEEDLLCVGHHLLVQKVTSRLTIVGGVLLEAFQPFQVDNLLYHVQALFVRLSESSGPVEQLGLELFTNDFFDNTHVFCVRSVRKVLGHLRLEEAILMPLGPDGRLRAQSVRIEELLVLL